MHLIIYSLILLIVMFFWKCRRLFVSDVKNPFLEDARRPLRTLVIDQQKRDQVLKNGFKEQKIPKDLDVIIIGSGIGGLCAAAILSKVGKKVLVLEQHDQAGGCCHVFIDKGYEFDVGIHYVGEMHYQSMIKTLTDQISDGQIQWEYLSDDFEIVVINDKINNKRNIYPIYADVDKQKSHLKELFPTERDAIDKYYEKVKEGSSGFEAAVFLKFLPLWLVNFLIKFRLINRISSFFKMNEVTAKEVVDKLTTNQELRDIFCYCFLDYGTLPSKVGFSFQAFLVNHYSKGASYPVGGASEIAHSIIPVIERGGGKVLVRAEVMSVLLNSERKAEGVRVKHGNQEYDIFAPVVISDAGILNTYLKLIPQNIASSSPLAKFFTKEKAPAALSLFVGLDASAEELEVPVKKNFWLFSKGDIDQATYEYMNLTKDQVENEDIPLMFVSFPSTKDPSWEKRYPGKTTMTAITFTNYEWFKDWEMEPCKRRGDDYDGFKKTIGWKLIDEVCKMFPKIRNHIDYIEIGTPLTSNFYIGSNDGSPYGLNHDQARFRPLDFALLRPTTDIPGLYLAGQDICSCGFGGAMFGGFICAQQVLGRNLLFDLTRFHKKISDKKK